MTFLQCKMCGGSIELSTDKTFGTCDCCGSLVTFPKVDTPQRTEMFNRGNHFRRIGEFDKALSVFESIIKEDYSDAEAHWCCALCRFGVEYVQDPLSHEWLPTCHRVSFDPFTQDIDYLAALEHSEGETCSQYEKDAVKIYEVQKGILATSQNEAPFDVFICYKETDAKGERTQDSVIAQDIYERLTEKGYRVFFARITLEQKLGTQYEPYIFAALNSAKVMLVVGTSQENLNAVWVKNEWSRFIALMKRDSSKVLIPCYRDMNPYDMPDSLAMLQSYDMSKIGFVQDLVYGIGKIIRKKEKTTVNVDAAVNEHLQKIAEEQAKSRIERGNAQFKLGNYREAYDYYLDGLATLKNDFYALYRKGICAIHLSPTNPPISELISGLEQTKEFCVKGIDRGMINQRDTDLSELMTLFYNQTSVINTAFSSDVGCLNQIQACYYTSKVLTSLVVYFTSDNPKENWLEKIIDQIDLWMKTRFYYVIVRGEKERRITYNIPKDILDEWQQERFNCAQMYNTLPVRLQREQKFVDSISEKEKELSKKNEELKQLEDKNQSIKDAFFEKNPELQKKVETNAFICVLIIVAGLCGAIASVVMFKKSILIAIAIFFGSAILGFIYTAIADSPVDAQLPESTKKLQKAISEKEREVSDAKREYQMSVDGLEAFKKSKK